MCLWICTLTPFHRGFAFSLYRKATDSAYFCMPPTPTCPIMSEQIMSYFKVVLLMLILYIHISMYMYGYFTYMYVCAPYCMPGMYGDQRPIAGLFSVVFKCTVNPNPCHCVQLGPRTLELSTHNTF